MNDDLYEAAVRLVRKTKTATVNDLRETLGIGYSRATKLIDAMEFHGVVSKLNKFRCRDVLDCSE